VTTVCGSCGHVDNDAAAQFCGSCGAFLEFVGAAEGPPADVVPAGASLPAHSAGAVRVDRVESSGADRPDQGQDGAAAVAGSVLPGAQAELRAPTRRVDRPGTGGLACPSCRVDNAADRSFCRRCGQELRAATGDPRATWWRRLVARVRDAVRARRRRAAGSRPRRWSRSPRRRAHRGLPLHLLTRVVCLLSLASLLLPAVRTPVVDHVRTGVSSVRSEVVDRYHDVRDRTSPADPGSPS
jgi:hypothetical protein